MTPLLIAVTLCSSFLVPLPKPWGNNSAGLAISLHLNPDSQMFVPGQGFLLRFATPQDPSELQRILDEKDGGRLSIRCAE